MCTWDRARVHVCICVSAGTCVCHGAEDEGDVVWALGQAVSMLRGQ